MWSLLASRICTTLPSSGKLGVPLFRGSELLLLRAASGSMEGAPGGAMQGGGPGERPSSGAPHRGRGRGRGRHRGEGHAGAGPSQQDKDGIDALGRALTKLLRHSALEQGLHMRPDGYVPVDDLLKLNMYTRANRPLRSHTIEDVQRAVALDNKQRLGLIDEDGTYFIRANQGHSIAVVESEHLLRQIESPEDVPICVHGTYMRNLNAILSQGLSRMGRVHIHFATGLPREDGVISGMRASCHVLIYLDVERALRDGIKLYISENNVVLSEGIGGTIPPKYFAQVLRWPSLQPIPLPDKGSAS